MARTALPCVRGRGTVRRLRFLRFFRPRPLSFGLYLAAEPGNAAIAIGELTVGDGQCIEQPPAKEVDLDSVDLVTLIESMRPPRQVNGPIGRTPVPGVLKTELGLGPRQATRAFPIRVTVVFWPGTLMHVGVSRGQAGGGWIGTSRDPQRELAPDATITELADALREVLAEVGALSSQ